jgi:hypothetical protein
MMSSYRQDGGADQGQRLWSFGQRLYPTYAVQATLTCFTFFPQSLLVDLIALFLGFLLADGGFNSKFVIRV